MTTAATLQIWINAQTGKAVAELKKFDSRLKATAATAATTVKSSERAAQSAERLGSAAKKATIATAGLATYGLYKAAKAGVEFEKQMSNLGAVAGANAKQMERLEKQSLKLGESTAFTAKEVAEAQTELAKGGLKVKQIYGGGVQSALALAAAGQLELGEAAETTVNAMKLFGLRGKDSMKIADALATAANQTTADVSDFAMALKQGGSVAKIAGLNFNQTVTILESLAEAGIKNSDAGTSMKASLIQLLKPSKKQKELTEELGIEWVKQNGTIKTAVGLSKEIRAATDGMTKAERAKTLATLAGTDGFRTLAALYDAGPAKLQKLEEANKKQGTAQEVAAKKMDNFQGTLEQLQGAAETLGIKVYKVMKPALKGVTEDVTEIVREISKIFDDKTLSGKEKFAKAFDLISTKAIEALSDIWPKFIEMGIEAVGKSGPQLVSALARGMTKAWTSMDPLGKLFSTALLIRAVGGKGALLGAGSTIGRFLGIGIASSAAASIGGTAAGGAAAGAAGAAAGGGLLGKLKGIKWARIGGIGLGIALADATLGEFSRRAKMGSSQLAEALEGTAESTLGKGSFLGDKDLFGIQVFQDDEGSKAEGILARLKEMGETKVKLSDQTIDAIRRQGEELDLTKSAREELQKMLEIAEAGQRLNAGVTLGMDPVKLRDIVSSFETLRSGVLTSMTDINSVVQRNSANIAQTLGTKSKEGRDKLAENFRSATVAIGEAMANGDISIEAGLKRQKELLRNANLVSGDDPFQIAKGFEASWKKAGGINKEKRDDMLRDLGKMPPEARQAAYDTMIEFGRGLVQKKKIPLQDLRDFKSEALARFTDLKTDGTKSTFDLAIGVAENFGAMGGSVASVLEIFRDNANNALVSFGVNKLDFIIKTVSGGLLKGMKAQEKQRGGMLTGGAPSGDSIPAVLERGEYVLNRNAVSMVGKGQLDALNFGMASRFQKGGQAGAPQLGGEGPLRELGQGAIDKTFKAMQAFIQKTRPEKSAGLSGGKVDTPLNFAKYMIEAGFPKVVRTISEGLGIIKGESNYQVNNAQGPGGHIGPWAESPAFGSVKTREDPRASTFAAYRVGWKPTQSFQQAWGQWQEQQGGYNGATRWGPEFEDEAARALKLKGFARGGLVQRLAGASASSSEGPSFESDFVHRMYNVWERAAHLFGKSPLSSPPKAWLPKGLTREQGDVANVTNGIVAFDRGWARKFIKGDDYAEQTMLHEWAHVFQRAGLKTWESEGGATNFARWASPSVYENYSQTAYPAGYRKYAENVKAQLGWDWIKKGQFGLGGSGSEPGPEKTGNPFNAALMSGTPTSAPKFLASTGFLPKTIERVKAKANLIAKNFTAYVWGGGHAEGNSVQANGLDCSGAVAKLMQQSGFNWPVAHSSVYAGYGKPGVGDLLTIWSNNDHTFAEIEGKMWGTNTSNGLGYHSHTTAGFTASHPLLAGGNGGNRTGADEKRAEGMQLKKAREGKAKELRAMVGKSKTMPGRRTALWDLINYFGQFGIFKDDKLKNDVLEKVRKASSFANPLKSIPSLNKLAGFLEDKVTLSGRGEGNFPDLADEIAKARERGQSVGAKRRRKIFKGMIAKGSFSPEQAAQFGNFSKSIETLEEQLGVKEGWASAANGPSGSDWNDTETSGVISLNEGLLANLTGKRGFDQDLLGQFSSRQAALTEVIKAARPKGSKNHWKLGAMLKEREGIRATIGTLREDLLDLQGITGEGGRINDVKLALANLGIGSSTSPSEADSNRAAYLEELLRQANQRNLIFERQKPIIDNFAGFHAKGGFIPTGQWGIAGEAGPEIVHGPAQVYSNSESAAMGVGRIVIEDNRVRIYDRSDREIEDVVLNMGRKQGRAGKTHGSKVAGRV